MTTSTRETTTSASIYDVRMAQFVLKIETLSHVMGPRASQDLRSSSPIMAPAKGDFEAALLHYIGCFFGENIFLFSKFSGPTIAFLAF